MGATRDIVADYYDVFNREVKEFLTPGVDRELRGSRIHVDSKVRSMEDTDMDRKEDTDDERESFYAESDNEGGSSGYDGYFTAEENSAEDDYRVPEEPPTFSLGSYWSGREKSIFFHCLSRHSIHRLDEWHVRLSHKSKFEILLYYKVLKYNLRELQRCNLVGNLISNADFPIAYEMDDFYVEWEEFMSRQVRIEYERSMPDNIEGGDHESSLLSIENWNKRWRAIYCKSNIEEIKPLSSDPLPYSSEAFELLTKCARDYTKKLVWRTVLEDMEKLNIAKRRLFPDEKLADNDDLVVHANEEELPHVVTQSSVLKAFNTLKQENSCIPTMPESLLRTLKKFQLEPKPAGKLFRNQHVTMSLLPSLFLQGTIEPVSLVSHSSYGATEPSSIHKKLYTIHSNGKRRKHDHDSFVPDDPFNSIDNPLEIDLCDWEAGLLEKRDLRLSKLHQHMILTYYGSGEELPYIQLESELTDQVEEVCPVDQVPSTVLNLFLHSNN